MTFDLLWLKYNHSNQWEPDLSQDFQDIIEFQKTKQLCGSVAS